MNCIDCAEELTETELRFKRGCISCHGIMHAECAMSDPRENDICECCLNSAPLEVVCGVCDNDITEPSALCAKCTGAVHRACLSPLRRPLTCRACSDYMEA
jgi:hypothetical protein